MKIKFLLLLAIPRKFAPSKISHYTVHTHTQSRYDTNWGARDAWSSGSFSSTIPLYIVSPKLALYDQWECMCLFNASLSLSSTGRHLEDRLTFHIYYRIVGNFRGRKPIATHKSFLHKILGVTPIYAISHSMKCSPSY